MDADGARARGLSGTPLRAAPLLAALLLAAPLPAAAAADLCAAALPRARDVGRQVSAFGCYRGYGEAEYEGFTRESVYVRVGDGTRLAVDIYRPVAGGRPAMGRLPVILTYSRYWRAVEKPDGSVVTELGILPPGRNSAPIAEFRDTPYQGSGVASLVRHGYVYVRAEARGTGASFGANFGDMSGVQARDGHDIVEWIAAQPWSNGRVGMRGHSDPGMAQHLTASTSPPHLVAIFPGVSPFDEYQSSWANTGILRKFGLAWLAREARRDGVQSGTQGSKVNPVDRVEDQVARVDADTDGSLRQAAREERRRVAGGDDPMRYFTVQTPAAAQMIAELQRAAGGIPIPQMIELLYSTPRLAELLARHPQTRASLLRLGFYRDASPMLTGPQETGPNSLAMLIPAINRSRVAVYNWGGWFDFATVDTTLWHANNRNQKKLTMGPWTHGWNEPDNPREDSQHELLQVEELRWFDYWLKGIDNGIMSEPAVHYAVIEAPQAWSWHAAADWPVRPTRPLSLYLAGTAAARGLVTELPAQAGRVQYQVDYGVSLGEHTRHHDAIGLGPLDYGDLDAHARRSLVFETPPLEADVVVAGHPIVELQLSATTPDLEVDAWLEDVDADGRPFMLTEGVLLASHRQPGTPPYDNLGLPFPDGRESVVRATPPLSHDRPALLAFPLQPTAVRFRKGHRVRLVLAGADAHTNLTIPWDPPPVLDVWTGKPAPSRLVLPVAAAP